MIIRVKQGYDEIKLDVGNFESAIALAESLMLYSSTNDLWLKLEEDPEPEEEPKEENKAPESKDETKEEDSEAQLDDSTTEETEQEDKRTRPRLTESQIGRIYALDDAGWTASQIADDVGCGIATVYNYMNKNLRSK